MPLKGLVKDSPIWQSALALVWLREADRIANAPMGNAKKKAAYTFLIRLGLGLPTACQLSPSMRQANPPNRPAPHVCRQVNFSMSAEPDLRGLMTFTPFWFYLIPCSFYSVYHLIYFGP